MAEVVPKVQPVARQEKVARMHSVWWPVQAEVL
jgi:hypothetical protein